jgi:GT2 family glycosyltransferase
VPEPPAVSVVIPTYRREDLLCAALKDVLALPYRDLEILVVDQTREHLPATQAFLDSVADRVRVLRQARPHVVTALNAGLAAARGEIVLFVDDDVRLFDRSLVACHVRNYTDPRIGGVTGRVIDGATRVEGRWDPRAADPVNGFFHTGWNHRTRAIVYTASGANMSFRRDLLVRLGGFDERFVGNAFRFENDVVLRLHQAGYAVVFDPDAEVLHFYGSPGGADNRHLLGRDPASHAWYSAFFHNHVYCDLKHAPRCHLPGRWWRLYRAHVLNGPYLAEGPAFLARRHAAFARGVAAGVWTWARRPREERLARRD